MRVNAFVSDVFFNLDHSDNKTEDGFDKAKLLNEAKWVADGFEGLGVFPGTPEAIVQDFLDRV